jgi:hypothetical protein
LTVSYTSAKRPLLENIKNNKNAKHKPKNFLYNFATVTPKGGQQQARQQHPLDAAPSYF